MEIPPARAALRREATEEEVFEAYQYKNTKRVGLPLPKKAPKIEATEFHFDKNRDSTGSYRGDLLKRAIYELEDLIGDKRREIYHVLPMNKDNRKLITSLGSQLSGLNDKLLRKIRELREKVDITLEVPQHFKNFPELED